MHILKRSRQPQILAMCIFILACASCGSTPKNVQPLNPAFARIIFTRQGSMVGGAVPHYIFDRGSGMTFDSVVTDKGPPNANSMTAGNAAVTMAPDALDGVADHPPLNARYIGEAHNGDTLVYDRPPGTLRIVAVVMNADEGVSSEFKLEAGKTYLVSYNYAQAFASHLFDFKEASQ